LTNKKYLNALEKARRLSRAEGIDAALQTHALDAIVSQAGPVPWLIDLVNGDASHKGGCSSGAVAGYPVITVPAGSYRGLPVGISFTGTAWAEPTLIRLAYAYEQAAQARLIPRFLPTVEDIY
jgi:amidase